METIVFRGFPSETEAFNRIYEEWKLETSTQRDMYKTSSIESMRNGNSTRLLWLGDIRFGFNRIYEEWKQHSFVSLSQSVCEFNRIYEEWKLADVKEVSWDPTPFNRIYEEWKPDCSTMSSTFLLAFNRIYEEWKPFSSSSTFVTSSVQSNL